MQVDGRRVWVTTWSEVICSDRNFLLACSRKEKKMSFGRICLPLVELFFCAGLFLHLTIYKFLDVYSTVDNEKQLPALPPTSSPSTHTCNDIHMCTGNFPNQNFLIYIQNQSQLLTNRIRIKLHPLPQHSGLGSK